jgi:hypothetical protein
MISTNAAVLDTLADCLESGDTLSAALEKVAAAGGAAEDWAQRIRRSVRTEVPVAAVLRESNVLDADELSLLSAESPAALASVLHAVALRRGRRLARRRAIAWGLVGPFVFGALTVVLDPLPNLITGGAYLWPVLRGLSVLVILAIAILGGIPVFLGVPRVRTGVLRICAAVPGARHLTALYAEEELTTALVPFVDGGEVGTRGLTAAASLLAWSPLGDALRVAARSVRPASMPLPMAGLDPLARQLSQATDLAIIGGVACKRLSEHLARRGEAITLFLNARLRLVVRIGAYALVALFSITSLAGMVARGLPGMPTLPGGATSPDQKQLEDLLKQLEQ